VCNIHINYITYNLILKFSFIVNEIKTCLVAPNFFIFNQLLKLIWFIMLRCIQVQFYNQSWVSNIITIIIINYYTTYLIINVTPSMKYIFLFIALHSFNKPEILKDLLIIKDFHWITYSKSLQLFSFGVPSKSSSLADLSSPSYIIIIILLLLMHNCSLDC
jgi:hypothetical protein